jgi:hypothetical protein
MGESGYLSWYSDYATTCATRVQSPAGSFFLFSIVSGLAVGPTQWVPGVKQPGHEADHLCHPELRLRMHGATFPYVFMVWCLVKH